MGKTTFCTCNFKKPYVVQTEDGKWCVYCQDCGKEVSSDNKEEAMTEWAEQYGMNLCFCCESSKVLPKNINTAECNLSVDEIKQKADVDCTMKPCVYTMSPLYLREFIRSADHERVLNNWGFVFVKNDGKKTLVNTEKLKEIIDDPYTNVLDMPVPVILSEAFNKNNV